MRAGTFVVLIRLVLVVVLTVLVLVVVLGAFLAVFVLASSSSSASSGALMSSSRRSPPPVLPRGWYDLAVADLAAASPPPLVAQQGHGARSAQIKPQPPGWRRGCRSLEEARRVVLDDQDDPGEPGRWGPWNDRSRRYCPWRSLEVQTIWPLSGTQGSWTVAFQLRLEGLTLTFQSDVTSSLVLSAANALGEATEVPSCVQWS